jgi:hypothetical protein
MSSVIHNRQTRFDWYEEVCQRLDVLKKEAVEFADDGDVLPSTQLFELVKQAVQDLRRLTDFQMVTPDVWLGPDGQIGLTWSKGDRSLDLIYSESRLTTRLTVGDKQQTVEPGFVPLELKQFAA